MKINRLPDFGIGHISVKEAGKVLTLDMWMQNGYPDIKAPENWRYPLLDSKLNDALNVKATDWEQQLVKAIEKGALKLSMEIRNLDDKLILESCYIKNSHVRKWLYRHNYYPNEPWEDWESIHEELDYYFEIDAELIRNNTESFDTFRRLKHGRMVDKNNPHEVIQAYESVVIENQRLREKLNQIETGQPIEPDKPLQERERRTLQNIIVVLIDFIEGKIPSTQKHPSFKNRAALFEDIDRFYKGYSGLSKRNLESKIPEAERNFKTQHKQ